MACPILCRVVLCNLLALSPLSAKPFRIQALDAENGWPVPMVELTTTHNVTFITDNAGVVAIDSPELIGRQTWFSVRSDGYELPADGFGNRGFQITPLADQSHTVKVTRTNIAKRLGRLTGAGIFAESQKLGAHLDWKESGIFGCDSIQATTHHGKKFWAWGDSNLSRYPLGIFDMASATTGLAPLKSFEPPIDLEFDYFRDEKDEPRGVANLEGDGPTWLNGYVSLPDKAGNQRLVATYSKIRGMLDTYRLGLCVWNDESENFESIKVLWEKSSGARKPHAPEGHPSLWADAAGKHWVLFGDPFPALRIPANFEAWQDPDQWEKIEPQRTLESATDGEIIFPHRGSIAWNEFRKKWVTIFTQLNGKPSPLGELWYAESDNPTGPWRKAVKILSHAEYTFYNPRLHPDLTPAGSPILLFEGTYTSTFSKTRNKTPRHDYNQILYRLDLDDPKLREHLP